MSIPKNHHYVSKCHIKYFFNEEKKKIYLYDKLRDNYFSKSTVKTVFSEDFSNTSIIGGKIDHETLEKELKALVEDDFNEIVKTVMYICENPSRPHGQHLELLCKLTLYGLIGEMRNPKHKKRNDDAVANIYAEFANNTNAETQKQLYSFQIRSQLTKYSNLLSYTEVAVNLIKRMGELDFSIFLIKSSDLFIIPDTTSFHVRAKINQYFNPDITEVARVGIPLTDKLFILIESKKLPETTSRIYTITEDNSSQVNGINKYIFDFAEQFVATSDENKLKRIIETCKVSV